MRWMFREMVMMASKATKLEEMTVAGLWRKPSTPIVATMLAAAAPKGRTTQRSCRNARRSTPITNIKTKPPKTARSVLTKAIMSAAIMGTPPRCSVARSENSDWTLRTASMSAARCASWRRRSSVLSRSRAGSGMSATRRAAVRPSADMSSSRKNGLPDSSSTARARSVSGDNSVRKPSVSSSSGTGGLFSKGASSTENTD